MNKYLRRRKNFSIFILIVGLLFIIFKESIALAIFGTTFIVTFYFFYGGFILFSIGVISLARLYFHGDI